MSFQAKTLNNFNQIVRLMGSEELIEAFVESKEGGTTRFRELAELSSGGGERIINFLFESFGGVSDNSMSPLETDPI